MHFLVDVDKNNSLDKLKVMPLHEQDEDLVVNLSNERAVVNTYV